MTSHAPTNAGKHFTTNIASAIQIKVSLIIDPNDVELIKLRFIPPFIGQNVISSGPTNELSIGQLTLSDKLVDKSRAKFTRKSNTAWVLFF